MTSGSSVLRKASARIEALETRAFFSGEIDRTLGYRGETTLPDNVSQVRAVAAQPDGKVLLAGKINGSNAAYVARYTKAGELDNTFGTKGVATVSAVNANYLDSLTVLNNGKILIGGTTYARLTTAGKIDTGYGGGDGVASSQLAGNRRAVQSTFVFGDGSLVELGDRASTKKNYVFKFKADGSVDRSFGSGGGFNVGSLGADETGAIAADPQGRIYVAYGVSGAVHVVRLTSAGKIDTTYGTKGVGSADGGTLDSITALGVLSDGRAVVAFEQQSGYGARDINVLDAKGKWDERSLGFGFTSVDRITQAKDGSVFFAGNYAPDYEPDLDRNIDFAYTAVAHFKGDLTRDRNYSSDKDGIGGFATGGFSKSSFERYVASAVTADGGVILVGRNGVDDTWVRLTPASEANRISVTRSAGSVVVNGGSVSDYMTVDDWENDSATGYDRLIQLDNSGGITSTDRVLVRDVTAAFKTTLNLNGGDDQVNGYEQFGVTVNGGAGNDNINMNAPKSVINGGAGNDTLVAHGDGSILHGDAGSDEVSYFYNSVAYGDDGNDSLLCFDGGTLSGGAGDDLLSHIYGKKLSTTLDGGSGRDTAYTTIGDKYLSIEVYAQTTGHG